MKQNFTSAATSINKTKLPAVYRKINHIMPGSIVMDYGCGKYTDHIRNHLSGINYLPYDPYNQPETVNRETVNRLNVARVNHEQVTVICSNVLNVIDSAIEIKQILSNIAAIIREPGSLGIITVYEGNRSGIGKQTGKDSWQRNQKLSDYLVFMPDYVKAHITNGMIIMERT